MTTKSIKSAGIEHGTRQGPLTRLARIVIKFKKVISNIGWLFAGRIFRMGLSMIAGIWVARYLGVEVFGILSFCMAVALLFRPMAMFQLEGVCVRELVAAPDQKNQILGSAFVLSLGAGLLCFGAVMGLVRILRPNEPVYGIIVAVAGIGLVFFCFEVFDYWFQARVRSRAVVISRTIVLIVSSCLKITGIWLHASVVFFAWVNMAEIVMTGAALGIVYYRSGNPITALRVKWAWMKKLFSDAWPLALSGLAATIYLRIDKIMLGQMADVSQVGIYTAATRLAEAWYFLPICIMTSLYPAVIRAQKDRSTDPDKGMQQIYKMMVLLGYATAIVTFFAAKPFILLLFGRVYESSAPVLGLYIWSGVFVNIAMAKAAWLKAKNYTRIQFVSTLAGAAVNIVLNLFLIKKFGVIGAAWATIISYAIEAYFILFLFPKTRKQAKMITVAFFKPLIRLKGID